MTVFQVRRGKGDGAESKRGRKWVEGGWGRGWGREAKWWEKMRSWIMTLAIIGLKRICTGGIDITQMESCFWILESPQFEV